MEMVEVGCEGLLSESMCHKSRGAGKHVCSSSLDRDCCDKYLVRFVGLPAGPLSRSSVGRPQQQTIRSESPVDICELFKDVTPEAPEARVFLKS